MTTFNKTIEPIYNPVIKEDIKKKEKIKELRLKAKSLYNEYLEIRKEIARLKSNGNDLYL